MEQNPSRIFTPKVKTVHLKVKWNPSKHFNRVAFYLTVLFLHQASFIKLGTKEFIHKSFAKVCVHENPGKLTKVLDFA